MCLKSLHYSSGYDTGLSAYCDWLLGTTLLPHCTTQCHTTTLCLPSATPTPMLCMHNSRSILPQKKICCQTVWSFANKRTHFIHSFIHSYLVKSPTHVLPHPLMSCPTHSCPAPPTHVLLHPLMSCPTHSCPAPPTHVLLHPLMSCPTHSCPGPPTHALLHLPLSVAGHTSSSPPCPSSHHPGQRAVNTNRQHCTLLCNKISLTS